MYHSILANYRFIAPYLINTFHSTSPALPSRCAPCSAGTILELRPCPHPLPCPLLLLCDELFEGHAQQGYISYIIPIHCAQSVTILAVVGRREYGENQPMECSQY
jgi:hypothetical protein